MAASAIVLGTAAQSRDQGALEARPTVEADGDDSFRPDEHWQAIAIREQRVGYGHQVITREQKDGETIVRTDLHVQMAVKRFLANVSVIIDQSMEETTDGRLLAFRYRMDNPPSSRLEKSGRVDGDKLIISTTVAERTTESTLTIPPNLRGSAYLDRIMDESPLKKGEQRELMTFDPQLGSVVKIRVTGDGPVEFNLPEQPKQQGTRCTLTYLDGLPGVSIQLFFNEAGESVLNESPLLGTSTWEVTREEALSAAPAEIDLGMAAIIPVSGGQGVHEASEAVYQLKSDAEIPEDRFATGETQSVRRIDPKTIELTVRSLKPKSLPASGSAAQPGPEYLASTVNAATDDPEIVKLAAAAAAADATPGEVAIGCEKQVHDWLTRKTMSSNLATASEVVRSREGDCTEHSVLLTALLRARKVPARMAIGIVYVEPFKALVGHAWTEAWLDGHWVPLDGTLGKGGIGSGHVKISDSSLADDQTSLIAGCVGVWTLLGSTKAEVVRKTSNSPSKPE